MITKYFKKIFKAKSCKSHTFIDFTALGNSELKGVKVGIEAYRKNVIVYRCVNLIAQSASHVPWIVNKNNRGALEKIPNHPVYNLLKRPNPEKAGADFFGEVIASKLLYGNAYILATLMNNRPREMYLLPSNATELVLDKNYPVAYRYMSSSGEKIYPISAINRMSKVLHLKNYHPTNSCYGLSCLDAASLSIDLHSQATSWNSSLLRNGARPSGALIVKESNGYLSDEQFDRLHEQLTEKFRLCCK